jgi:hypothetical protein
MTGTLERWKVGRWMILGMVLSNIPTVQLSAQVGHDPGASPFRDIPLLAAPVAYVGSLSGDRGVAGAGMSNAVTFGARYEIPAGRSLLFQFTGAYLSGDRFIVDPRADSDSAARRTGPFKSDLALAEIGLQLRLTGSKSWHGFAPYCGTALGFVFDVNSPGDTTGSGYRFGSKFTLAGATGVRWYPSRRLMINAEARAQLWRLSYPLSFYDSTKASDGSRVLPLTQPRKDWTLHPWFSVGIGWTF